MKHLLAFILPLLNSFLGLAQLKVYNEFTNQIMYSTNCIVSGDTTIITSETSGFDLHLIDTNGNIANYKHYGNPSPNIDILESAHRNSNNEIMLMGRTLGAGNNNQIAYVVITDTFGNHKREFTFKKPSNLFNKVYNGLYLNGSYYFIGMQYDSTSITPSYTDLFIAKTDTFGNQIWNTTNFVQYHSETVRRAAIESSFDSQSILFGSTYLDSFLVNSPYTEYYSYLMNQIDTNGNFVNRIPLPNLNTSIIVYPNYISQISKIDNYYYAVGNTDLFILDSAFNIVHHDTILTYVATAGDIVHKSLLDNSYIVGGFKGFVKFENGIALFEKDFTNEPNLVNLQDIVPTNDGGYFALFASDFGNTRYIKMDCEGNYINPTWCAPVSSISIKNYTIDVSLISTSDSWKLYFSSPTNYDYQLNIFNCQGQLVKTEYINRGSILFNINTSLITQGIYYIKLSSKFGACTLKAIKY